MTSHPMPHSFAKVANERGVIFRHLFPSITTTQLRISSGRSQNRRTCVDGRRVVHLCPTSLWRLMNCHRVVNIGQLGLGIVLPH